MMIWNEFVPLPVMNAEGAGGGAPATDQTPAAEDPAPESVLFPDEGSAEGEDPSSDASAVDDNATGDDKGDKADDGDKGQDDPLDRVPEDGNYTFELPDGVDEDKEMSAALGSEFKELGLTQRQAQRLVDKYLEIQSKRAQEEAAGFQRLVADWADQAKADSEIGGANWETTKANARRAVATLGNQKLREYFDATGGGNHPEVIRFMAKVGAMIREDEPANGGTEGAGRPVDPAHRLFPNDVPMKG